MKGIYPEHKNRAKEERKKTPTRKNIQEEDKILNKRKKRKEKKKGMYKRGLSGI